MTTFLLNSETRRRRDHSLSWTGGKSTWEEEKNGYKKKFHRHSKNIIFQPKLISSSKSISLK